MIVRSAGAPLPPARSLPSVRSTLLLAAVGGAVALLAARRGAAEPAVAPFARRILADSTYAWARSVTPHFRLHAPHGTWAADRLDSLGRALEEARAAVRSALDAGRDDAPASDPAIVFLLPARADFERLVGRPVGGWTEPAANTILLGARADAAPPMRHELAHLHSHRAWGRESSTFASEGVAMAAVGGCGGVSLHGWARAVRHAGLALPLAAHEARFGRESLAAHLEAGSFVTWLRDAHGHPAVRALWRHGVAGAARHVGTDAAALERAWRAVVADQRLDPALDPRGAVRCEGATPTAGYAPRGIPADRAPLIGLVPLPEVFGAGPCDRYTPRPVPLYAEPDDRTPLGEIAVATPWTFDPAGGCSGLEVVARLAGREAPLPTREVGYEEPAALVVGTSPGGWLRVRLDDSTAAWVRVADADRYRPIETLLVDGLAYLSDAWDGRVAREPGGALVAADSPLTRTGAAVRALAVRSVRDARWVQVALLDHSVCEGDAEPLVRTTVWLPLHDARGEPTVWFHSRGC